MVAINDRRDAVGSGDFNNPRGTFEIVSPGDAEVHRWTGANVRDVGHDVRNYYSGQKSTQTWAEANRLAARRTAHQGRMSGGFKDAADYAFAYHDHLARVMAVKGRGIAEEKGELQHRQSGYGRV